MTVEKRRGKSTLLTINGETKTVSEWAQEKGIDNEIINSRLRNGWTEDKLFKEVVPSTRRSFDNHYFDIIDDEHKAYWLGFIWSDGYLGYRIRENNREEYNLKLSLMEKDYTHLEKFNNDIQGDYQIHYYTYGESAFNSNTGREARLFITNRYFGKILRDKYGIIPFREDCSKLIDCIPNHLMIHFIRGVVDADGTFCKYTVKEHDYIRDKYTINICGTETLLKHIEDYFIKIGLLNNINRKLYKRHKEENKDVGCRTLVLSGKNNTINILNCLYKNADVYLERKYEKYLEIVGDAN